jgi:5-methylcytosine-specific restriction endonuclease McrA
MKLLTISVIAFAIFCFPLESRSAKARSLFMWENPCPATGKNEGRCYGYEVDHVIPLKCGGADHKSNMQWLTIDEHKAKTKREAKLCLKKKG